MKLLAYTTLITGLLVLSACKDKPAPGPTPSQPEKSTLQLEFILPGEPLAIERDYNQRGAVEIRNLGGELARIRLQAEGTDDLLAGFAGRGSEAWQSDEVALGIPAGETWSLPLLLHADRAAPGDYGVTLRALDFGRDNQVATEASLAVQVRKPEVKISAKLLPIEGELAQARLGQRLHLKNEGAILSDLTVQFRQDGKDATGQLVFRPALDEFRLARGQRKEMEIYPRLSPNFTGIAGELVLVGGGEEVTIPFAAKLPAGKQVYVTLSRTTRRQEVGGQRCTNRPSVS